MAGIHERRPVRYQWRVLREVRVCASAALMLMAPMNPGSPEVNGQLQAHASRDAGTPRQAGGEDRLRT